MQTKFLNYKNNKDQAKTNIQTHFSLKKLYQFQCVQQTINFIQRTAKKCV